MILIRMQLEDYCQLNFSKSFWKPWKREIGLAGSSQFFAVLPTLKILSFSSIWSAKSSISWLMLSTFISRTSSLADDSSSMVHKWFITTVTALLYVVIYPTQCVPYFRLWQGMYILYWIHWNTVFGKVSWKHLLNVISFMTKNSYPDTFL